MTDREGEPLQAVTFKDTVEGQLVTHLANGRFVSQFGSGVAARPQNRFEPFAAISAFHIDDGKGLNPVDRRTRRERPLLSLAAVGNIGRGLVLRGTNPAMAGRVSGAIRSER